MDASHATLWMVKVGCRCLKPSSGAREQLHPPMAKPPAPQALPRLADVSTPTDACSAYVLHGCLIHGAAVVA
eukprot:4420793-Pyramimonas_sp.AAC.1